MRTYKFYVDRKVTTWVRETHYLDAKSIYEAMSTMKEDFEDNLCQDTDTFSEREMMYDTEECITVKENGDNPTVELYVDEDNGLEFIADNILDS